MGPRTHVSYHLGHPWHFCNGPAGHSSLQSIAFSSNVGTVRVEKHPEKAGPGFLSPWRLEKNASFAARV